MARADLARHMAEGEKKRQEYDYTEIEDRLRLKLDTLKDKIKDLTGAELEELEWDLDACLRVAKLFTGRRQPIGQPTTPERPEPTEIGHARRTVPHGQAVGYDGSTGKRPLGEKDGAE